MLKILGDPVQNLVACMTRLLESAPLHSAVHHFSFFLKFETSCCVMYNSEWNFSLSTYFIIDINSSYYYSDMF